ncbi:MAG: hypothetical protein AB7U82_07175 [Blastocatellales bacterium]
MNTKFTRIALTSIFLLAAAVAVNAQVTGSARNTASKPAAQPVTPKPVVYTTAAKLTVSKLKASETDVFDVRGKITFTVTAANSDDTVAGTMNYTIPDDARQKIAAMTGKPLNSVPSSITRKDVIAGFQKATAPPIINLEISPMDVDVVGAKVHFNRVVLDVPARDGGAKFSNEEMEALFTGWARQILNGRARRGIIATMNRRLAGEDEQ